MAPKTYSGYHLKFMFIEGANSLFNSKDKVDSLNVFPVPDGDTGTNMNLTMQTACKEMNKLETENTEEILDVFSKGSLMGARGNSGVILSQLFRGFSKYLREHENFDIFDFTKALVNGVNTAYKAILKPVEGTMLTVAKDGVLRAKEFLQQSESMTLADLIEEVVEGAKESLEKTPEKLPALKEAGVVDAGGMGLLLIYQGMLKGLNKSIIGDDSSMGQLEKDYTESESQKINFQGENILDFDTKESLKDTEKLIYCTELMIKGQNLVEIELKEELYKLGDSLLVVGDNDLLKVHIHTDRPGLVLDKCCKKGELTNIKVDNMREQHQEMLQKDLINKSEKDQSPGKGLVNEEKAEESGKKVTENYNVDYKEEEIGLIVVANGEGFKEIFEGLGADMVLAGGQSMNPSTQDILDCIEKVGKNRAIIIPNNKNIIMSCKQVLGLTKKEVEIVETKSIPQGIAAMMEFDASGEDIRELKSTMEEASMEVVTGEVTYAVRDTNVNNTYVNEGDYIGLVEGKITTVSKKLEEVAYKTACSVAMEKDKEILSIFMGQDVSREDGLNLKEKIHAQIEDLEIELYYGGQPLYYYIFSGE